MRKLFYILFFLLTDFGFAQNNLVNNSGFESVSIAFPCTSCTSSNYSDQVKYWDNIDYWTIPELKTFCELGVFPNVGSPDVNCNVAKTGNNN